MKEKETKNIILYSSLDGILKLEVPIDGETVWLSQKQMSELFACSTDNVGLHLKNVFKQGELDEKSVTEDSSATASDGKTYVITHYNLDAIISVGYRVNSIRGTQFRIWATNKLREYIVKGFVLDDERLAEGKKSGYFDELLERIRAIRASERNFYQKITDIYATALDHDTSATATKRFFAAVQNKP
ncbi:MAG: RhuM family protein [Pseudomonadota bacterium]